MRHLCGWNCPHYTAILVAVKATQETHYAQKLSCHRHWCVQRAAHCRMDGERCSPHRGSVPFSQQRPAGGRSSGMGHRQPVCQREAGHPGSLCKISEYREPFHRHMGGGLCAAERRSAPLPCLHLPRQPDAGGHSRSTQHPALCAALPAHRHPVPALQQHLSAVCRQKSRAAGRS